MRVYLEGTGAGDPVTTFTVLGNAAVGQGYEVLIEDPVALATGSGRFFIDVPQVASSDDAIAVVRAMLDQIPAGAAAFKLSPGQE